MPIPDLRTIGGIFPQFIRQVRCRNKCCRRGRGPAVASPGPWLGGLGSTAPWAFAVVHRGGRRHRRLRCQAEGAASSHASGAQEAGSCSSRDPRNLASWALFDVLVGHSGISVILATLAIVRFGSPRDVSTSHVARGQADQDPHRRRAASRWTQAWSRPAGRPPPRGSTPPSVTPGQAGRGGPRRPGAAAAGHTEHRVRQRRTARARPPPRRSPVTSFAGLGDLAGARVLAEIGDDRGRFADARSLKAYAGPGHQSLRPQPVRHPPQGEKRPAGRRRVVMGLRRRHALARRQRPSTTAAVTSETATLPPYAKPAHRLPTACRLAGLTTRPQRSRQPPKSPTPAAA